MTMQISIKQAFFHTLFLNNISRILLLASGVVMARALGPDGRGDVAMIIATLTILSIFGSIVNGANEILMGEDNGNKNLLVRQTLLWSVVLSLIVLVVVVGVPEATLTYVFGSSNDRLYYIFPLLLFFFVSEEGLRRILLARQEFKYINNIQTLSTVVYVFFIVIFIGVFNFEVFTVILIYLLQQLFCVIGYLIKITSIPLLNNNNISKGSLLRDSLPIGIKSLLLGVPTLLLLQSDILLIKYFTDSASVGLYQIAVSISMLLLMFPRILSVIIRGKAVSEQSGFDSVVLIAKIYVVFAILTVILFNFFGHELVIIIFGNDFSNSYVPALILLLGNIFWGYGDILVGYIVAKNRYPIVLSIGFNFAFIINIVINVLLIPKYGFIVAAWSSLVSYAIMSMICVYKFKSITGLTIKEMLWFNGGELNKITGLIFKKNV